MTKTISFGWVFMLAAILIMIFALGITWWVAILVALLANTDFTITYR